MQTLRVQTLMLLMLCAISSTLKAAPSRPFTVQDSIEMSTFSDPFVRHPGDVCKMSPDGAHFLVVTTRGVLKRNELVSTIWLFNVKEVITYTNSSHLDRPRPRRLEEVSASPNALQNDSYGAVITKTQWDPASKSVLFLAENPGGRRELRRVSISNRRIQVISGTGQDVVDYAIRGETIVYSARTTGNEINARELGQAINTNSNVLTGMTLPQIIDPEFASSAPFRPSDLWMIRGGVRKRINPPSQRDHWSIPVAAYMLPLALSSDGEHLITVRSVPSANPEWRLYRTASHFFSFQQVASEPESGNGAWRWPWQYLYIDLRKGTSLPLVDAPATSYAGFGDPFEILWSEDGKRAIFTGSYFPLRGTDELLRRQHPCAVAVFTVATKKSDCISFARYPEQAIHLLHASFGVSSDEVQISWTHSAGPSTVRFRERSGNWEPANASSPEPSQPNGLVVSVKQDLDIPPTLNVEDRTTGHSKQLWDPNPQLADLELGTASTYTWKDSSGYTWTGALVKPSGYVLGRKYPLVIQTHGFHEHEYLVDGSYTTGFAARPLAVAGIIVLQMGTRTDRLKLPPADEATATVRGFLSAVDQLAGDGTIDSSRVGIIGFSRTAWYVETALIEAPQRFEAASLIDGIDQSYMNYMLFCPENMQCRSESDAVNGGPPFGNTFGSWPSNAAGFRLNRVETPIRIEAITRLSILEEWEIYSSLRLQNKPVDLIYFPNGQHILQRPLERYASQEGNVDWFRYWLQDYERNNPEDIDQYRRWDGMKKYTTHH